MPGRISVAAPPFQPARYGLLSVAALIDEADPHWRNGLLFSPLPCGSAFTYGDACPPPNDQTKVIERGMSFGGADPFTVYAGLLCTPVGLTEDEIMARATAALVNGEGRAVERGFWTGALDNNETLKGRLAENSPEVSGEIEFPAATVITGGPHPLRIGVALLEEALGDCYGGRGVLHMDRYCASLLSDGTNGIDVEGSNLVTRLGTYVAAGAGYPGTAPGNAAPASGTRWIYATGAIRITRSGVEPVGQFPTTLRRNVNDVLQIVERTYTVGWDCCLFAVQIEEPTT